jgi:hypothetical protein
LSAALTPQARGQQLLAPRLRDQLHESNQDITNKVFPKQLK